MSADLEHQKSAFLAWFKMHHGPVPFYDDNPEEYNAYIRVRAKLWRCWQRGEISARA